MAIREQTRKALYEDILMQREKTRRPVWQLRAVIPALMAVVFLVDAGTRFMPIDPFTYRAWEALARARPLGMVFEPTRRYYNARSYGNLTAMGNFPELRRYRPVRVTTDALGYRNASHVLDEEISAILAGDSFAVGAEVGDDRTLSSRLSNLTGCVVYNAGGLESDTGPNRILALARRLHLRSRLVIRLYTEESLHTEEFGVSLPSRREGFYGRLVASMPVGFQGLVGRLRGLIEVSPLRVVTEHTLKRLEDDRVLPNTHAANVVRATLYNGETMLFWGPTVNNFYRKNAIDLDYWKWLRDDLQKAHFDLLVVLVPGKYRVYRPFLVNQRPLDPGAGDSLDRLDRALRAMGIRVLNLTPVLSAEATRYLEHGEYLYWLDDFHWNARGIALAAEAIREAWLPAGASCRSPVARRPEGP
jgi:SGNH hydrolase-like domain, acetyltransferase AlgX